MISHTNELVEKARRGDKDAQNDILETYAPFVKKIVRYYGILLNREDREDLFIEGLLALIRSINSYNQHKGNFDDLTFIAIRNAILDYMRKRRTEKPLEEYYEDKFDIEEYITLKTEIEEFEQALTPMEKQVFALYLEGRKIGEIAEFIGKSYKSVDNAMQRIKKRASEFFKK